MSLGIDSGLLPELPRIEVGRLSLTGLAPSLTDSRGEGFAGGDEYHQDHRPVRALDEMVGHAVRAGYTSAAMADVARFSEAKALQDGTLYVEVPDSETAMHLSMQRQRFLDVYRGRFSVREVREIAIDVAIAATSRVIAEKLDKDRFRRDLGGEEEAYQEVARRLGILPEAGPRDMKGPEIAQ